jgi:hypothetical protein
MKPTLKMKDWYWLPASQVMSGIVSGKLVDVKVIATAKDSEDTVIIESEDSYYILENK